jgi:UDP-3-O-[3-hydroxymyristoyl] N-acetylglucosamine deacetylase
MERRTISQARSLRGTGVWTGEEVEVVARPAPAGQGIVFVREGARIPATLGHAVEAPNCTGLRAGEAEVYTVEHLLSAAAGLGVTDLTVEVSGPELPLLDGSARPFVELLQAAGLQGLGAHCGPIRLREPVRVGEGHVMLIAMPAPCTRLAYWLEHAHPLIGRQYACFWPDRNAYAEELAGARTFVTEAEASALIAEGWLKSGGEENAIVAYDDRLSEEPRLPAAFARHKIVDLLGDLWLLGRPVLADVVGWRSGHRENMALAQRIQAQAELP